MTAGFPWIKGHGGETRQACIKIHANENIMTFQDLIHGNWFDRFTKKNSTAIVLKKQKNEWKTNDLKSIWIYLDMIYASYFA